MIFHKHEFKLQVSNIQFNKIARFPIIDEDNDERTRK